MKLTLSLSELLLLVALAALSGYVAHGYLATPNSVRAEIAPLAEAETSLPPGSAALSSPTSSQASGPAPVQTADRPESDAAARVGEPDVSPELQGTDLMQTAPDDSAAAPAPSGDSRGLDPNYDAYLNELEAQENAEDAAEDVFEEIEAGPDPEDVFEFDDEDETESLDPEAYDEYLSGVAERAEQRRLEREERVAD